VTEPRKLGEPRTDTIEIRLSDEQVVDRRKRACDIRDQLVALAEEAKLAAAGFRQRKKALENQEAVLRYAASTRIELVNIVVQDWIAKGNEVVSVRIDDDSRDVVARRTATADELQEGLFGGDDEDETGFGKPS
jgi:anti-sigma factor ChrR (cupin superfamily)